jgi:hypothetical protein
MFLQLELQVAAPPHETLQFEVQPVSSQLVAPAQASWQFPPGQSSLQVSPLQLNWQLPPEHCCSQSPLSQTHELPLHSRFEQPDSVSVNAATTPRMMRFKVIDSISFVRGTALLPKPVEGAYVFSRSESIVYRGCWLSSGRW